MPHSAHTPASGSSRLGRGILPHPLWRRQGKARAHRRRPHQDHHPRQAARRQGHHRQISTHPAAHHLGNARDYLGYSRDQLYKARDHLYNVRAYPGNSHDHHGKSRDHLGNARNHPETWRDDISAVSPGFCFVRVRLHPDGKARNSGFGLCNDDFLPRNDEIKPRNKFFRHRGHDGIGCADFGD